MTLSRVSKFFLQSIFAAQAPEAVVEWWKFDPVTGKAVGRQASRAVLAAPARDDAVYWSVGLMRPGRGRSNANVMSVHALVADDVGTKVDQELVDMFMPLPTEVVESSAGNYQYVWAVPEGMTVAEHQMLWAGMEEVLGCRMDGSDPGHLFRLPEGVNGKPGKLSFPVTSTRRNSGGFYRFKELASLLPAARAPGLRGSGAHVAGKSGGAPVEAGQIRDALGVLPNNGTSPWCDTRKAWIDMGMAIKGALGDEGLPLWEAWCSGQPQDEDPIDVWEGLNPHSIGWGYIEILAKTYGGSGLAAAAFDDGMPGLGELVLQIDAKRKRTLDDFWYHSPSGKFIDRVTRDLWPAGSVDAEVPVSGVVDSKKKPISSSRVVKVSRIVHQLSWIPGLGEIVENTIVKSGGVTREPGNRIFNLYEPPAEIVGNAQMSLPWTAHVRKLYPGDAEHIFNWFAHRVQRPGEKINHALVLGGDPGIGKDTLIEPLVAGVGGWNFSDVKPSQLMDRFNAHRKSVVLRVNEVYDLGEGLNRVKFYQMAKTVIASPPETLQIEQKGIDVYSVPNVVGVIMTTNHKLDGLYLPEDDRRHYVAWSKATASDFDGDYFNRLYSWFKGGGMGHVVAFLRDRDISGFDAKAPPLKTRAFRSITAVSKGAANDEIFDVIEAMGKPDVFAWEDFMNKAPGALHDLAKVNTRALSTRIEQEGYEKIENPANSRGRWRVGENWVKIWGRRDMTTRDQLAAAEKLAAKKTAEASKFSP